ncbi:MAG: DUF2589 domain-containing protein [Bacteroidia bacterium]
MPGYVTRILTELPFANIIGGPLKAAIEAQALAARSTLEFIQLMGFNETNLNVLTPTPSTGTTNAASVSMGEIRTITFTYVAHDDEETTGTRNVSLTVPILTILPIPYLRIDEMTIDFMVKITEETKKDFTANNTVDFSYSGGAGIGNMPAWVMPVNVGFKGSLSAKHSSTSSRSSRYQTEATMNVHVRAVQDDMPAGLAKVLGILENAVRAVPQ